MKLRLSDFDALTPQEFDAVYKCFERTCIREPWEQVRFLATATLTPHSKKALKGTDVVKFQWDNERRETVKVDKDEARRRFERLKNIL